MPKIIELIGPSGAGKTNIYNQLKNQWNPNDNWVPFDYIHSTRKKLLKRYTRKVFKRVIPMLFNKKSIEKTKITEEWKFIDHTNRTFLGDKYADFKTTIMDLVEEYCKEGFDGSDKRFNTIYMIMWSLAHIETVKSNVNDNRYCLLKQGEGLVSRIMHLTTPGFNEKALRQYLQVIPFPDILIMLDVQPEEVMQRIKNRNRYSSLHKGMNEDMIYEYTKDTIKYLHISLEEAEKSGSKVYKLNSTLDSIDQTSKKVLEILSAQ